MFEILLLIGLLAAGMSQLLPEENYPPRSAQRNKRGESANNKEKRILTTVRRTGLKSPNYQTSRPRRSSDRDRNIIFLTHRETA